MLTKDQKFDLMREFLESDMGFEADSVMLDIVRNLHVSEREKSLAELVSRLYTIVHPHKGCPHKDWEEENETRYNIMKKGIKPPIS